MLPLKRLLTLFSATLLALLGAIVWLSTPFNPSPVQAAPMLQTRYVSTTGSDDSGGYNLCTNGASPCRTPQHAVEVAIANEEILVATGVYTGVQALYGMTQVVYIDINVDLLGGYSPDFTEHDPTLYPTILDAQGQGRVVSIVDTRGLARLDGFTITGGNAHGLSLNCPTSQGCGGGIFVYTSTVEITNNVITGNVAATPAFPTSSSGGGLCLSYADGSLISGNQIVNNTASLGYSGMGGGMHLFFSNDVLVDDNQVLSNTATTHPSASGSGGGIAVQGAGITAPDSLPNTTIQGNRIQGNRTNSSGSGSGAGISTFYNTGVITGNHLVGNIGGQTVLLSYNSPGRFEANRAIDNNTGVGVDVRNGSTESLTLANNIIANSGDRSLSFSADYGAPLTTNLIHNTLVGDGGGYGVYIANEFVTLNMTNTIVASHTVGITNTAPAFSSLNASHTLFWGNQDNGITGASPVYGNPRFVNPSGGDYHLLPGSSAIDFGILTPVVTDIDGEPRPFGLAPDIGADESDSTNIKTYLPLILCNH